ncbi:hypothetical protein [Amycolatopsis sp. H20-H5]|uniref:hypothetical protein n=1 Tax=Amycolatopsis sp. H20-H5 TaxID=3046309 RepID=UPI002DB874F0|nr:hypothetical protein [Amycolatopsis sp. H20-H5]MEC3977774.1 hypothetical protein [Amycolatopsis sp. H20-H5]
MQIHHYVLLGVWAAIAPVAGWLVYRSLVSSMPWQWCQGQTKARIVVASILCGLLWPSVVLIAGLYVIPGVGRWIEAFILWKKPQPRRAQPNPGGDRDF